MFGEARMRGAGSIEMFGRWRRRLQ